MCVACLRANATACLICLENESLFVWLEFIHMCCCDWSSTAGRTNRQTERNALPLQARCDSNVWVNIHIDVSFMLPHLLPHLNLTSNRGVFIDAHTRWRICIFIRCQWSERTKQASVLESSKVKSMQHKVFPQAWIYCAWERRECEQQAASVQIRHTLTNKRWSHAVTRRGNMALKEKNKW